MSNAQSFPEEPQMLVQHGEAGRVRLASADLPVSAKPPEGLASKGWTLAMALLGLVIIGVMVAILVFMLWGVYHVIPA